MGGLSLSGEGFGWGGAETRSGGKTGNSIESGSSKNCLRIDAEAYDSDTTPISRPLSYSASRLSILNRNTNAVPGADSNIAGVGKHRKFARDSMTTFDIINTGGI